MGLTNLTGNIYGTIHKVRTRQVRPTDPTPVEGDEYFDTSAGIDYIHDGTRWWGTLIGTSTSTSTTSSSTSISTTTTSSSSSSISTTSSSISTSTTSSSSTSTT